MGTRMENTIWFRMAKGDEPTKLTGFTTEDKDDIIDLYFENQCGGVYKWWRGDKSREPLDTSISNNSKEDLLGFEFLNTSISSEKSNIDTTNNVKAVCKYCGIEFNNYGIPSPYCCIECFDKGSGLGELIVKSELNRIEEQFNWEHHGKQGENQ